MKSTNENVIRKPLCLYPKKIFEYKEKKVVTFKERASDCAVKYD